MILVFISYRCIRMSNCCTVSDYRRSFIKKKLNFGLSNFGCNGWCIWTDKSSIYTLIRYHGIRKENKGANRVTNRRKLWWIQFNLTSENMTDHCRSPDRDLSVLLMDHFVEIVKLKELVEDVDFSRPNGVSVCVWNDLKMNFDIDAYFASSS